MTFPEFDPDEYEELLAEENEGVADADWEYPDASDILPPEVWVETIRLIGDGIKFPQAYRKALDTFGLTEAVKAYDDALALYHRNGY